MQNDLIPTAATELLSRPLTDDEPESGGLIFPIPDQPSGLERAQRFCNLIAHVLSLFAVLVVVWWITMLGGLSWSHGESKKVFNWHPFMMITAFCFMTVATLAFRAPYKSVVRDNNKFMHAIAWTVAAICGTVALLAVFRSHNDPIGGFTANLYSLHSWIGMTVVVAYVVQFFGGALTFLPFLTMVSSPSLKSIVLQIHTFVGPCVYFSTAATILLGIQEKEGFVGCSYKVDNADLFPIQHISKIPAACLVSHLLGLVVFATALFTGLATYDFSASRSGGGIRRNE